MEWLHRLTITDQDYATDAHIYSPSEIVVNMDDVHELLAAQEIIEAQWLGQFPAFIFVPSEESEDTFPQFPEQLYGNTHLILPEEWKIVEDTSIFLVNQRMYEFCKVEEPPHFDMNYATSDGLQELFDREMFVVAATLSPIAIRNVRQADSMAGGGARSETAKSYS